MRIIIGWCILRYKYDCEFINSFDSLFKQSGVQEKTMNASIMYVRNYLLLLLRVNIDMPDYDVSVLMVKY